MSTIPGIDHNANVEQNFDDDLTVDGKIDGQSTAALRSKGSIEVKGKIDGQSHVSLNALGGTLVIDDKIDGQSTAQLQAKGDLVIKGKIDGQCTVTLVAGGSVIIEDKVDGQCTLTITAGGAIRISGKVDGQCKLTLNAKAQIVFDDELDNTNPPKGALTTVDWTGASFTVAKGIHGDVRVTMPSLAGKVAYFGSQRPAVGLTVEIQVNGNAVKRAVTSRDGSFTIDTVTDPDAQLVLRRGTFEYHRQAIFNGTNQSSLKLTVDLPDALKALRQKVASNTTLRRRAQFAFQWLISDPRWPWLIDSTYSIADDDDDTFGARSFDNPHLYCGDLLVALAVSEHFFNHPDVATQSAMNDWDKGRVSSQLDLVHALIEAMVGRMKSMSERSPERGYMPRWIAKSGPVGDSSTARQGDPSIDEYSGILMGLNWTQQLVAPYTGHVVVGPKVRGDDTSEIVAGPSNEYTMDIGAHCRSLLSDVKSYFELRGYWLIRPRDPVDVCFNGPFSVAARYGIEAALASALGGDPGVGGHPFQPPQIAVDAYNNSRAEIPHLDYYLVRKDPDSNKSAADSYAQTLDMLELFVLPTSKEATDLLAPLVIATVEAAAVIMPWLPALAAAEAPVIVQSLVVNCTGLDAWRLFSSVIGNAAQLQKVIDVASAVIKQKPFQLNNNSFMVPIYDRIALAAWDRPEVQSSWIDSSHRPGGFDAKFWRPLTLGIAAWMGSDIVGTDDYVSQLIPPADDPDFNFGAAGGAAEQALPESALVGYSLLALALDFDPAIDWLGAFYLRSVTLAPNTMCTLSDAITFGMAPINVVPNDNQSSRTLAWDGTQLLPPITNDAQSGNAPVLGALCSLGVIDYLRYDQPIPKDGFVPCGVPPLVGEAFAIQVNHGQPGTAGYYGYWPALVQVSAIPGDGTITLDYLAFLPTLKLQARFAN